MEHTKEELQSQFEAFTLEEKEQACNLLMDVNKQPECFNSTWKAASEEVQIWFLDNMGHIAESWKR